MCSNKRPRVVNYTKAYLMPLQYSWELKENATTKFVRNSLSLSLSLTQGLWSF